MYTFFIFSVSVPLSQGASLRIEVPD
jgi:hypothetical protein